MRASVLSSALVVMLIWALPSWAQSNTMRTLGSALTGPPLVIADDLVMESVGLHEVIRDLSDPLDSALIGWLNHDLSGYYGLRLHDDGIVVALHSGPPWGVDVLDVSNPSAPALVYSLTGNPYRSAWFDDGRLALAQSAYAVFYDLQDPSAPSFQALRLMGEHEGNRWFCQLGDVLYGIDRGADLRGFDLSQPSDPIDLGTITLPGLRIEALIAGPGLLYALVSGQPGAGSVDLVTLRRDGPMQFTTTATTALASDPSPGPFQLARDGSLLLAAPGDGTVRAFDLGDPLQPAAGFVLPRRADHLAIGQQQIYVMGADTLHTYGRTPADQAPSLTSARPAIPDFRTIVGQGPVVLAQLHDAPHQVVPVDVSNPGLIQPAPAIDLGFGEIISFGDDLLITTDSTERFDIWDVSDPYAPVMLSSRRVAGMLHGRALIDGPRAAFFDVGNLGVALYDISDPAAPVVGTAIRTPYPRAYHDGMLISGLGSPLLLFDATDVQGPKLASRIQLNGSPLAATLIDGLAIVTVERLPGEVTLHVFDISAPADPTEIGSVPVPGRATNLIPHGHRIYAQGYSTTWVVDLRAPQQPLVVGQFDTWGEAGRGLAFNGDLTINSGWLVSLRDDGFVITSAPAAVPQRPALHPAYPNPFNPSTTIGFALPRSMRVTLSIHDVRGRTVATLVEGALGAGDHIRHWHGLDQQGQPVASGVYLVRLRGEGLDAHRTVTLIK